MNPNKRTLTPIVRLMAAMDRCAVAQGEANWTNGYRAAKGSPEEARLYAKEVRQWGRVTIEQRNFRRLALRLLREARLSNSGRGETHG